MKFNNRITAYLGVGSNLGNREENIKSAILLLKENKVDIVRQSSFIETDPVGGPPHQNKYLNGVLKITTKHTAPRLLTVLKTIERKLGRVKAVENDPRPIDLDILLYGELKLDTPQLIIPHPRMKERDFVMKPLLEIEPDIFDEN